MMSGQEHLNVKEVQVLFDFAPGKNYLDIHRLKGDLTLGKYYRCRYLCHHNKVVGISYILKPCIS